MDTDHPTTGGDDTLAEQGVSHLPLFHTAGLARGEAALQSPVGWVATGPSSTASAALGGKPAGKSYAAWEQSAPVQTLAAGAVWD